MRLTVRHHFDFGADRAVVGDDLVRPDAWDALRTRTSGAFALADTREEWERTADEHPELEARARRLDAVFARRGAGMSPPTAIGGATLECWLNRLAPSASSSSPTTPPPPSSGCGRSSPRPSASCTTCRPIRRSTPICTSSTGSTRSSTTAAGRRSSSGSGTCRSCSSRPGRSISAAPLRRCARAAGAGASRAGWVRTRGAIEALWRETHSAVPVDVGDLPAWELAPR